MTAPAPSPYEQRQIDRFGIFDEERVVEEVARAICESDEDGAWESWPDHVQVVYRRYAAAAVAAYRATQDGDGAR